ncbi:hypothetical protein GJAV_G00102410 [Gymnothorax javanicus]|nr:hypothetical protein GJAV_G00102410 [Gymnothorax javanicus]
MEPVSHFQRILFISGPWCGDTVSDYTVGYSEKPIADRFWAQHSTGCNSRELQVCSRTGRGPTETERR